MYPMLAFVPRVMLRFGRLHRDRVVWGLLGSWSVLTACGQRSDEELAPLTLHVAEVGISPGEAVETDPGVGAGLFVATTASGEWQLTTSCDTEFTGYACDWDIVVSVPPGEELLDFEVIDGEAFDAVYRIDAGAFQWLTLTSGDFDEAAFTAAPGQPVRFDVLLDGVSDPSFIYWSFAGEIMAGAPSDPVDFVPQP